MEEWFFYVIEKKIYVTYLMEFLAAFAGSLYLFFSGSKEKEQRLFVKFLWSVLIIDVMGGYAGLAYFDNYEHFGFLKGTPFVRNEWYFNIAQVYFIVCYSYFLREKIRTRRFRVLLNWAMIFYVIFAVINMYLSDDFFENDVIINYITGAFVILIAVFFYFFDMMLGDQVLSFYKKLFFYVAVGIAISFLVRIPTTIYNKFYNLNNPEFNQVVLELVRYSNIFMYSVFVLGFYMEFRNRKKKEMVLEETTR